MSALATLTRASLSKDLRLEWRSKDAINSMLFFALLVVVIFSFSFDPTAEESRRIAGGLVWVAFLFAAVVGLNQTWARELRNHAAATPLSHLDSGVAGDGRRNHRNPDGRLLSEILDRAAGRLQCGIHHSLLAFVRQRIERGMRNEC